jgi:UDP-N-acetylmuramoylalanine--D-glutamate ligase
MQTLERYNNEKIAILGFGVEGKATFEYLLKHGIKADILDKKDDPNYLDKLKNYNVVFKTPGISPLLPEIVTAKKNGVIFTSQIEEFFNSCPAQIIGITGTKGKGTTSTIIYDILKAGEYDVYLGGNIGAPAIEFLDQLKVSSWVVLELSSFQLQVLEKSPHIAVVLNITSEHLDYHKDTEEYRKAKRNIVSHQNENDLAIINDDYEVSRNFAKSTPASKYFFSRDHKVEGCYVDDKDQIILNVEGENVVIATFNELKLRGRHNLENVTAASLTAYLAGANPETISKVVRNFLGLEHRLELVCEVSGVKYYNDSFSTTPETAIAALDSFTEPIILIAGGSSKRSDYRELGKKIADSNVKTLILIGDTADEIKSAIPNFKGEIVLGLAKMAEIVVEATKWSKEGDVVLLSPASASFGLFENYKDRGNQFKAAVQKLYTE